MSFLRFSDDLVLLADSENDRVHKLSIKTDNNTLDRVESFRHLVLTRDVKRTVEVKSRIDQTKTEFTNNNKKKKKHTVLQKQAHKGE